MIRFEDLQTKLQEINLECTIKEYLFATQIAMGGDVSEAYVQTILVDKHDGQSQTMVTTSYKVNANEAKKYAKKEQIMQAVAIIKDDIAKMANAMVQKNKMVANTAPPTIDEIKNWIGAVIRSNLNSSDVIDKDSIKLIETYLTKLYSDEDPQKVIDKYTFKVLPKFNGQCGGCGQEMDLWAGVAAICPICGAINDLTEIGRTRVLMPKDEYVSKVKEIISYMREHNLC